MWVRRPTPDRMWPAHPTSPEAPMAEHDDDHHGQSTAAWVMVGLVLLGTGLVALAMILPNTPLLVVGVVVTVAGLVAGKVLSLAGHGVDGAVSRRDTNVPS